jgi:AbrB family looped-hinge helix DNA binding protein
LGGGGAAEDREKFAASARVVSITKSIYRILFDKKYGEWRLGYTVTEKGTVTIPSEVRKNLGLEKGSKVEFVKTDDGYLLVPVVPLEELCGADRDRKEVVYRMIRELHAEHRREASGEE